MPDEQDQTADRNGSGSPIHNAALGLGAVSAGAMGLAHGMASDGQISNLRQAISSYKPEAFTQGQLPLNRTGLTHYEATMSPAAQLKPFGIPVGQALVKIWSDPNLMQALGTPSYTLKTPAEQYGVSGLSHYNMFANGAVPAYAHQLKARLSHTPVPAEFGGPAGTTYSDWMGRKLEDFVAARTGQRINPFEMNLNFMPHDQQVGLMEQFHQSLSPEEQAFRLKAEDPGRRELFQLVISNVKGKQARNSAYSRQEKWFLFTAIRQVGQSTADPRWPIVMRKEMVGSLEC